MPTTPADESDYDRLTRIKESWSRFNDVPMGDIVWLLRISERALRAEAVLPREPPPLGDSGGASDLELRWSRDTLPEPGEQYPTYHLFAGGVRSPIGYLLSWQWPQLRDMRWRWSWNSVLPGVGIAPGGTEAAETRTFEEARDQLEEVTREWFRAVIPGLPQDSPGDEFDPAAIVIPQLFFAPERITELRSQTATITPFEVGALLSDWETLHGSLSELAPLVTAVKVVRDLRTDDDPVELTCAVETALEDGGTWQSCTGCYEVVDGQPLGDYPYSHLMCCHQGGGCSECGGLGVVWHPPHPSETGA